MWAHNHWSIPQQQFYNQLNKDQMTKISSFNLCPGIWDGTEQKRTTVNVEVGDESDQDRTLSL